jgi:hypothetical protein
MMRFIFKMSCVVFLFSGNAVNAQNFTVHKHKQLFVGLTGGVNFSMMNVREQFDVLTPTDLSERTEKTYGTLFENRGHQFGFHAMYGLNRNLSLVGQVHYYTTQFRYMNQFSWMDTVYNMNTDREFLHVQKISTISVPVLIRYDFSRKQFTPYIQGGIYTDFRHKAFKQVRQDFTIDGEVNDENLNKTPYHDVTPHFNRFGFGAMGGAGIAFFSKYIVLGLEANYRYGFSNMTNDRNRYADVSGFTTEYLDVFDQLKSSNINVQFSVIVPFYNLQTINVLRRTRY